MRTRLPPGQSRQRLQDTTGTREPAATTGTHARRAASPPRQRPASAPPDHSALLTDLSATVSHILALQLSHAGDVEVQNRLRRAVAELELLITHLLRSDGSRSPAAPQPSATTPRQRAVEQAFVGWLAQPTSTDDLTLANSDGPEPLVQILGELSLSMQDLPAETAARLGLPDGTTIGHVALEVLLAVKDPAGPRCRSFRAAVYYLRDLDRDRFAWQDDRQAAQ